jgi:spermidine synthase
MKPWIELDTATVPGGETRLRLMQRGEEYSIMLGTNELMNSRLSGSEEDLARLACEPIKERPKAHILIGGLGMGFTLRAALKLMGADARITVGEIVPQVIAWAHGPLGPVFGDCLADPRVKVVQADVRRLIEAGKNTYDAVMLDVDNGPDGVSRDGNDALYSRSGLSAERAALRPGGVLAVWSAHPSAEFTRRLGGMGFASVEEHKVRARSGGRGARHVIWTARKAQS